MLFQRFFQNYFFILQALKFILEYNFFYSKLKPFKFWFKIVTHLTGDWLIQPFSSTSSSPMYSTLFWKAWQSTRERALQRAISKATTLKIKRENKQP